MNTRKPSKTFLYISCLLILIFNGCDPAQSLEIVNENEFDISVADLNGSDSIINNNGYYVNNPIYKKSTGQLWMMGTNAISRYINEGHDKKLYLYVFHLDTLLKYQTEISVNNLIRRKKYVQLMTFSEKELIANDWKVVIK